MVKQLSRLGVLGFLVAILMGMPDTSSACTLEELLDDYAQLQLMLDGVELRTSADHEQAPGIINTTFHATRTLSTAQTVTHVWLIHYFSGMDNFSDKVNYCIPFHHSRLGNSTVYKLIPAALAAGSKHYLATKYSICCSLPHPHLDSGAVISHHTLPRPGLSAIERFILLSVYRT